MKTHKPKEQYNTAMYTHTHGYFLHFFAPLPLPTHQEKATTATHTQNNKTEAPITTACLSNYFQQQISTRGTFHLHFYCKKISIKCCKVPLVGAAASIIFVATKHVFCYDKSRLATTKLLSHQNCVCWDKSKLVATKRLIRQNYVCRDKRRICHDKTFVMTK